MWLLLLGGDMIACACRHEQELALVCERGLAAAAGLACEDWGESDVQYKSTVQTTLIRQVALFER